ncbi:MAG: YraN family protein [Candidatus Limnocylindrales bacterium]|jgi:Holliday junction resolvase-like predicted endonuclease
MDETARDGGRRTASQAAGDAAERLVAERLATRGWRILGRNVHAGRSELDIVAVDPGPPERLVVVEVRWRRSREFGLAEESFDRRKRSHLRSGLARLLEAGSLPNGVALPRLPVALDLAVVEPGDRGRPAVRLYRDALTG